MDGRNVEEAEKDRKMRRVTEAEERKKVEGKGQGKEGNRRE